MTATMTMTPIPHAGADSEKKNDIFEWLFFNIIEYYVAYKW